MDGANAWQRFWMITRAADQAGHPGGAAVPHPGRVPGLRQHLRPDQRRQRAPARCRCVAYDNLIRGLNLGIGSTMSVLIFITIAIIAFIFIKLFGAAAPGADPEGGAAMQTETTQRKLTWWARQRPRPALRVRPGGLDHLAVAQGRRPRSTTASTCPTRRPGTATRRSSRTTDFLRALINSIGICLISTFIALVLGTMAAYAIARLDFPGKTAIVGVSLLISMFPQIALVTPLFKIETAHRAVRHLARPDHPLRHLRAAAGDLHAVGVLPGDPVGAGEGGQDGRGHARTRRSAR